MRWDERPEFRAPTGLMRQPTLLPYASDSRSTDLLLVSAELNQYGTIDNLPSTLDPGRGVQAE